MTETQGFLLNLRCATCGALTKVVVAQRPQFGFEVAALAKQAGFVGVIDTEYARTLVFCSALCADRQRLKNGNFRKRLRPTEAEGLDAV